MAAYSFSGVRIYVAPYLTTVTVAGTYLPEVPARTFGPPEACDEGSGEEITIDRAEVQLETPAGDGPVIDLKQLPEYLALADEFWRLLEDGVSAAMKLGARYAA